MPVTPEENKQLRQIAKELRMTVIDVMAWAGGAHIGGSLSCLDLLVALYFKYLNIDPARPDWEERDRFVLSKGHAAASYIPVLAKRGYFPEEELRTFNHFGSPFGMHPDSRKVVGCDVSAGSLGHGLPVSFGMGLGFRYQGRPNKVVCIMGDGECCEGSIWEAAMAIAHYGLTNVIPIVDRNMLMIDAGTEEEIGLEPFADKWRAFGFEPLEIDGHDFFAIGEALDRAWAAEEKPVVIIAKTVKGKGVSFMENQLAYHYANGDTVMCEQAKASIEAMYGED